MTKEEIKLELSKATPLEDHYDFIGIKAYHMMGDISRDFDGSDINKEFNNKEEIVENMFHSSKETDKFYIGAWHTGLGFFDVLFPKETSRPLTDKELKICPEYYGQINSQPPVKQTIKTKK